MKHNTNNSDKMLLFIVLLCCSVDVSYCLNQDQCLPAQEGRPYDIECIIHLNSGVGFFLWNSVSGLEKKELANCKGFELSCEDHDTDNYFTTNTVSANGTVLTSKLTIRKVSPKDRNLTFECKSWNTFLDKHSIVKSCILKTYQFPENPRCQAEKLESNEVQVSCQVSRFYPDISCQMFQVYDDQSEQISGNISYNNNQTIYESGVRYSSTVCSNVFNLEFPGTFIILVKIHPKIQGEILFDSRMEIFTNEVNVSPVLSVKLEQSPEFSDCQSSEAITPFTAFICWAESFMEPHFRWYLDDILLSSDPNVTSQDLNETTFAYSLFSSTYTLSQNNSRLGQNLTCEVFYGNSSTGEEFETLRDSLELTYTTPELRPPVFKDENGMQIEEVSLIHPDTALDLSCEIADGQRAEISNLILDCWNTFHSQENFIHRKSSSTSLAFSVKLAEIGNSKGSFCSCTVQYVNGCQKTNSTSSVLKLHYGFQTETTAKRLLQKESAESWQRGIILGVAVGLVLALLSFSVTAVFLYKYQNKLGLSGVDREEIGFNG